MTAEQIVNVDRSIFNSIRINNADGTPVCVQLPVNIVFFADVLFREMSYRGKQSPDLKIVRSEGGNGSVMWQCEFGHLRSWSCTPWGAIKSLGEKIAESSSFHDAKLEKCYELQEKGQM